MHIRFPAKRKAAEAHRASAAFRLAGKRGGSAAAVGGVAVGREGDGHMVVRAILNFKYYFDEGVERLLLLALEIGLGYKG